VCLGTNLLNRDINVYAQSLGPQSKQDPTKCALVMAKASIGRVGEVFELRDVTKFHRRWVESTSPASFGQCTITGGTIENDMAPGGSTSAAPTDVPAAPVRQPQVHVQLVQVLDAKRTN
jgi:hypothetical protein